MGIKFDKDALAIKQNNYLTKVANFDTVYDLNDWPKGLVINFRFRNSLFGAVNIVKSNDEKRYVYSG